MREREGNPSCRGSAMEGKQGATRRRAPYHETSADESNLGSGPTTVVTGVRFHDGR